MKTPASIVAASLLLVGCGYGTPPSAYKHPRDQFFAAVPLPIIDEDFVPCFRTINGEPGRLPDAECYRFEKPRRMRGVAITGFETGSFFPERTTLPHDTERSDIWLELDPHVLPGNLRSSCREGCAVFLDFIGRRTAVEGGYGHMGGKKHQVVVDRVLDATPACHVEGEGKMLFVGTPECLSELPKKRMSGVWVLGHEYSVFYEGRRSGSQLPAGSYSDVWLDAQPSKVLPAHGLQFDGKTHAYRVEFIGTISAAPGVYGNGMYKRGALVLQMLSLDEIPFSRQSRS